MRKLKKALSLFLMIVMLCGMLLISVSAADTDLTVTLCDGSGNTIENNTVAASDQTQTVRMEVTTVSQIDLCSIGYTVELPEGWTVIGFDNEDPDIDITAAHYDLPSKTVVWNTAIMASMEDIKTDDIGTIIVEVPANTPVGDYTITMSTLSVTKAYGTEYIHNKVDVFAVLTISDDNAGPGLDNNANVNIGSTDYADVSAKDWFYSAVDYVAANGLMGGIGDGKFDPNGTMTRSMLVTVLYRLEGSPAVTSKNTFSDVESNQWYTNAVIWASENEIVGGYGNGLFGTNDSVTREQIATILYRYAQHKGYDIGKIANLSGYTDAASVSNWAAAGMSWAKAEGLITGRTMTTLVPQGTANRAEVATILMRLCENVAE